MRKLLLFTALFMLGTGFLPERSHAIWPLTWELGGEKRYLGPLISYDEKNEGNHLALRPFLFSYDSEDGGAYHYLYPLGKVSPEKSYFVPVYLSKRMGEESDWAFLLFFGGKSSQGAYGGFFPFYGRLYDRFAKDEMGFAAWPLFSYTRDDGATKTNILWPFFASYGGTDTGFKAWPFYGTRERPGVKKTEFALWPIFFKIDKNLDTDAPIHSFLALPFYVHSRSPSSEYKSVLWPFFVYSRNSNAEDWKILWPFFSKTKGEEINGYSFFPFISRSNKGKDNSLSVLWPIYTEDEYFVRDERFFRRSVLILNRYVEDDRGTFFNIWPFFEHEKNNEESILLIPSILPFRDRGFNRIVKPLITIYEQKTTPKEKTANFLYGLFTHEETDESWETRFAFLFSVKGGNRGAGFEILSGLFAVDRDRIRIFFIPFNRSSAE